MTTTYAQNNVKILGECDNVSDVMFVTPAFYFYFFYFLPFPVHDLSVVVKGN